MVARNNRTSETTCVAVLCALLIAAIHSKHIYDADDGVTLDGAWNLLHGIVPYTNSFEFIPPGSFYLIFAVWKVIGPSYWSARLVGCILVFAGAIGIHRISLLVADETGRPSKLWLRAWPAICFCLLSAPFPIISHNVFSIAIVIWVTYVACLGLHNPRIVTWIGTGVLLGLSALFLHPRAFAVAVALSSALALRWWQTAQRRWFAYIAILALFSSLAASTVFLFWDIEVLWHHTIRFPLERYRAVNQGGPEGLIATMALVISVAWLLRDDFKPPVVLLIILQILLLLSTASNPDWLHIMFVLFPVLCLLAAAVDLPGNSLPAKTLPVIATVLPLAISIVGMPGRFLTRSFPFPLWQMVQTHCPDTPYLYAGPFLPGVHFEARKLNPTGYGLLLNDYNTNDQFQDALEDMKKYRPDCVIIDRHFAKRHTGRDWDNPVNDYIVANYEPAEQYGTMQLLKRKTQP